MSAGKNVYNNVRAIIQYCNDNPAELELLLDIDYSNRMFGIAFPFFIDVNAINEADPRTQSRRFLKRTEFFVGNRTVRVTSQWTYANIRRFKEYLSRKGIEPVVPIIIEDNSGKTKRTIGRQSKWPKWEEPAEDQIYQLAQITTEYIRFLNPEIIAEITKDNENHKREWRDLLLKNNIDPDLYLWDNSPCCFPGIRRYAGSKEIAFFRNHTRMDRDEIPDALRLDDNSFPKHIWAFVFTGKEFRKSGPGAYSLAHLFDHKKSKNRMKDELEFIAGDNYSKPYHGLFTCPSNTVYIPNSLLKPTDFNFTLRRLLFQKAEYLYKDYCNILPPFIKVPEPENEKWKIDNFQWGECVGTMNNISSFLEYRNRIMDDLIRNIQ